MTNAATAGPVTLEDTRAALGETDPNSTNAGAVRRTLGRGSLSTIQKHLDNIRQELAAPALEALGAAPDVPKELLQAVWSAAWTAAQARTAGALAQAQALVAQQAQELAVARADALAGQQEADEAAQALVAAQALAEQQANDAAQVLEAAQALAAQQADQAAQALAQQQQAQAALRQEQAKLQQAQELQQAQHAAVAATLRGEVDRLVSQLADLRAALGTGKVA